MTELSRVSRSFVVSLALVLSSFHAADALAYFDPASGSLMLQMILGGIAGVAVLVKLYWHKLLGLLGIQTSSPDAESDEDDSDVSDVGEGDEDDDARN